MFTIKTHQVDKKKRFTLLAVGFSAFLLIAGRWIVLHAARAGRV